MTKGRAVSEAVGHMRLNHRRLQGFCLVMVGSKNQPNLSPVSSSCYSDSLSKIPPVPTRKCLNSEVDPGAKCVGWYLPGGIRPEPSSLSLSESVHSRIAEKGLPGFGC